MAGRLSLLTPVEDEHGQRLGQREQRGRGQDGDRVRGGVDVDLRLARPLAEDLRRPWEKPAPPGRLTPARVRRSFRNLRARTVLPARAPEPARPGAGRPPGSRNHIPAPRYDVGKTVERDLTITARRQRAAGERSRVPLRLPP
jgi:hypothetical protein